MSSAIKRLSTIIRPGHSKDKSASTEERSSDSKPQDTNGTTELKATEASAEQPAVPSEPPKDTPADADKPAPAADAPVPTDEPAAANGEAEKPAETSPDASAAPKAADSTTRRERSARDIGRDTIRRFSSILRAQGKDTTKDPAPPLPKTDDAAIDAPAAPAALDATSEAPVAEAPPAEDTAAADADAATPAATPAKSKKDKEKKEKEKPAIDKTAKRRSSFFQGLQRSKTPSKPKEVKEKAKAEVVPRLIKKGAAKGKRVIVINGANGTAGLELVKQLAVQPDAFVIALSRGADKATELKSLVTASAKRDHNVRALRLDAISAKSVAATVKEIVELTDGRIDVLINATETRADPTVKMWDIKGSELEEELQHNLIGPITVTNALLPYLKPFEKKKEEVKPTEEEKPKPEEPVAAADGETAATTTEAAPAPASDAEPAASSLAEKAATEVASEKQGDAEATEAAASVPLPVTETSANGAEEAAAKSQSEAAAEPEPEPFLPSAPFILFFAPADTIANQNGSVPTGHTFAPAPRNLFTISRAALQVAIAKYALGLGSKGVGVVGVERAGLNDPHSKISEEDAVKGVLKLLPGLTVLENGKLLRSDA